MKRIGILMVSAAVAGVLLSGCGEKKGESGTHDAPVAAKERSGAAAAAAPASAPAAQEAPAAEPEVPAKSAAEPAIEPVNEPVKEPATEAAEAAAAAKVEAAQKVEEVQKSVEESVEEAKETVAGQVGSAESTVDAATLYTKCAGCHGLKGEKHALGQSNVIGGQSKEELAKKIEGYKNGTYGGAMKGLMAGQVKNLTPEEIDALADYISKL